VHVLFLQNFACWQFGSNGTLWSLAHEFWYYLLWPLLLLALFSRRPRRVKILLASIIVVAAASLSVTQFTGSPLLPYMLIWLLGVWASACRRPIIGDVTVAALVFVVALAAIRIFVRYEQYVGVTALALDLGLSIIFANLIAAMRMTPQLRMPPGRHLHQRFADFSFSLYCWHTPVLMAYAAALTAAIGTGWRMVPHGATEWAIVAGGLALSIAVSYSMSLVTEKRTNDLRRWVFTRLGWSAAPQRVPAEERDPRRQAAVAGR
jgi:peptidoglycan/LPS O-acetylase OafA/YrhL